MTKINVGLSLDKETYEKAKAKARSENKLISWIINSYLEQYNKE